MTEDQPGSTTGTPTSPRRGIAYFGSRILRHVRADLQELAALGFTDVLHPCSEEDMRFYHAQLGRIVAAGDEVGLRSTVAPSGLAGLFGGESASFFVAENPHSLQVNRHGQVFPGACPTNPATRDLIRRWLDTMAAARPARVLWDEPCWRVPEDAGLRCWCRHCLAAGFADRSPDEPLLALLSFAATEARSRGLTNVLCLLPEEMDDAGVQDWSAAARLPYLDELTSDPYWQTAGLDPRSFVADVMARLRQAATGTDLRLSCWLQGYGLGPADEQDFAVAVQTLTDLGVTDLWCWGFEACGHMSELGTSDPEQVWRYLVRSLTGATVPTG